MFTPLRRLTTISIVLAIGAALVAETAWSQTKLWRNPANGNWTDGTKWDPPGAPTAGDSVSITLAGTYAVTLDVNATVARLILGAATGSQTLTMGTARTLTLNASSSVEPGGVLDLTGATIELPSGGSLLTDRGLLRCQGNCSIGGSGALEVVPGATVRVQGSGSGSGTLTVANGFGNEGLIELTNVVAGQGATLNVTAGTLTNQAGGQIRALAGAGTAARALGAELNNLGTLEVALGAGSTFTLSKSSAHHSNGSLIDLNGGNFTISLGGTAPSFANSGTIDGTGGGEVTISGGTFNNTGTLSVASGQTLTLSSDVFNWSAGVVGGSGTTLSLSAATMNATPNYSTAGITLVMSSSTWNGPGTLTNASTVPLALTSSSINAPFVQMGGTLECRGSCNLGGAFSTNPSDSVIRVQGSTSGSGTLTVANGFGNEGLIELTNTTAGQGATLNVTAGTLTNQAGGQIRALAGAGTAARALGAELNNLGTLEVALGASSTFTLSKSSAHHSNGNLIDLNGGTFTINQTGTAPSFANNGTIDGTGGGDVTISGGTFNNTGTLSVALGQTLTLQNSNVFNWSAGVVGGSGTTLSLSGATMNATPNYSTAGITLLMNSATWNGPGTLTNDSPAPLTLTSSSINAPFVQMGGTLECRGSCNLGGAFSTNPSDSVIRVQGSASGPGTLTVANGFGNEGLIELTNTTAGQGATLNVTAGTLTNQAGGQIRALAGAGTAARVLGAELNNLGTLEVALGASSTFTLSKSSAHHSNGNLIDLNGGNFTINQTGTAPSFANSGTIDGIGGGEVTISGGTFNDTGTLSVALGQTLTLQNSNVFNWSAGAVGGSGITLSLSGATMNATPNYSTAGITMLMSSSTWNGPGTLTNASTVPLALTSSSINAPFVQMGGTLECRGSCVLGGAFSTNPSDSVIRVQGSTSGSGTLTVANGFGNEGLIELTNTTAGQGATLNVTAGTLTNQAGGQIRALAGVGTAARSLGAELNNLGTLEVALGASSTFTLSKSSAHHSDGNLIDLNGGNFTINQTGTAPSFANSGTIDGIGGGEVTISGGTFNNTGTLSVALGQTLTLQNSNVFNWSAGVVGGSGITLSLSGATMNATPNYSTAGITMLMSSSTWNGPGTLTNASTVPLALTSSSINAPFVQMGGTLECRGSCVLGGAFSTNPSDSVIRVQGSASGPGTLTVPHGFVNGGIIELTNTLSGQTAALNVSSETLVNQAGGEIRALGGVGSANRTLGAQLDNSGTVTVDLGGSSTFTLSKTSSDHVNSGQIRLTGGSFLLSQTGITPTLTNTGSIHVGNGLNFTITGGSLTNFSGTTLSGGIYEIAGTFKFPGADIATNRATIVLDGTGAQILDASNQDGLRNFSLNDANGSFTIGNGKNVSRNGSFANRGTLAIGPSSTLTLVGASSDYVQDSGLSRLDRGTLNVGRTISLQAGLLEGTGTINGQLWNSGEIRPGLPTLLRPRSGAATRATAAATKPSRLSIPLPGLGSSGSRRGPSASEDQGGGDALTSTGDLVVVGDYQQLSTGQLRIEYGGAAPGQFDRLLVSGSATLDGLLETAPVDSFVISQRDSLLVLSSAALIGQFSTIVNQDSCCARVVYDPSGVRIIGVPWPGACCDPATGGCTITTQVQCAGSWLGKDTACDPNPCPQPGACCLGDQCLFTTESNCNANNGQYYGVGAPCAPNPCTMGACCLVYNCLISTAADCAGNGGNYMGNRTDCDPNPCEANSSVERLLGNLSLKSLSVVPNPSTGPVMIFYRLPEAAAVTVEIFAASGSLVRHLAEGRQGAGPHMARWDRLDDGGRGVHSGVYFTRLRTPGGVITGRVVLARD